jgi:lipopolysaccharide export system permease protein
LNLLDRHIFKSVLFTCAASVGLFAFVMILGNAVKDLLGYVLAGQLSLGTFARLVGMLVPFVISFALPMGMLTGVLLTLGRLSADSEITAMRAAGLSLLRIARPVFIIGTLGTALGLYVNFESMPRARVQYHRELDEAIRTNPLSFIVPKTFIRDFPGYVVYIGEKQGSVMHDFWLWRLDRDRRVTQFVRAESGRFDYDAVTNELILTLTRAQVETRDAKTPEVFSEAQLVGSFEKSEPMRLSLDRLYNRTGGRSQKLKWMTFDELQVELGRVAGQTVPPEKAKEHARAEMKVRLTIQEKYTLSLSVLAFALVGVPLGIRVSRRETSANLGLAVALALGYYVLTVAVDALDRHPEYRPDILLWLPNLLFFAVGIWLFRRIEK